ncbi:MAG: Fic family protein [Candidatus Gracilibacteria bacterium]|nr:Fic family protein [Candidatus Gracilibacteria bacterium]
MSKTEPTFRETKLGVLPIEMIESIIFDNVILVKSYIFEQYKILDFSVETILLFHKMLCENLYPEAGLYRKHNVRMGNFNPVDFYKVPIQMKDLDADIKTRIPHLKTDTEKKSFLAYIMWRILWIHPFFDYNGRVTRLFGELFLLKNNMSLSTFSGTKRTDFTNAMKKATEENIFDDIENMF